MATRLTLTHSAVVHGGHYCQHGCSHIKGYNYAQFGCVQFLGLWNWLTTYDKAELLAKEKVRSLNCPSALFLQAIIDLLGRAVWLKALEQCLKEHSHPKFIRRFFEESVIEDPTTDRYLFSHTHRLLRRYT